MLYFLFIFLFICIVVFCWSFPFLRRAHKECLYFDYLYNRSLEFDLKKSTENLIQHCNKQSCENCCFYFSDGYCQLHNPSCWNISPSTFKIK